MSDANGSAKLGADEARLTLVLPRGLRAELERDRFGERSQPERGIGKAIAARLSPSQREVAGVRGRSSRLRACARSARRTEVLATQPTVAAQSGDSLDPQPQTS